MILRVFLPLFFLIEFDVDPDCGKTAINEQSRDKLDE